MKADSWRFIPESRPYGRTLVLPLLFLALTGCAPKEEDAAEPEKPAVAFEGSPDAQYAGTWKAEKGNSSYAFEKDGTFTMKGKASTPKGPSEYSSKGQWKVTKDRFLFKDENGVVPYAYTLVGNKLTLTMTGSMKNQTVLIRQ